MTTRPPQPIRYLLQIVRGECSDASAQWVRDGLLEFMRSRGQTPLEQCLGLTKGTARKARDAALLRAAVELHGGRDISAWSLAGELEHALHRFDRLRQRHDRASLSALDRALFDALYLPCAPLRSRMHLYLLLRDSPENYFCEDRACLNERDK